MKEYTKAQYHLCGNLGSKKNRREPISSCVYSF
ncbi:hypothetical protein FHS90_002370 [Rufibacter quisquiliarum]|uniref:Uncharacterized protein n=1 Tax=Rufibacter quisquiliarum TaxID=1549639 RepID=A0A839GFH6_9BACT|nr:hypothetical protein [Rufibacter quisquiliarum]